MGPRASAPCTWPLRGFKYSGRGRAGKGFGGLERARIPVRRTETGAPRKHRTRPLGEQRITHQDLNWPRA